MKTSNGYTTEREAQKEGKYVVWYRTNPTATTYYVPFSNKRVADNFARTQGINDPDSSPRSCGFCDGERAL